MPLGWVLIASFPILTCVYLWPALKLLPLSVIDARQASWLDTDLIFSWGWMGLIALCVGVLSLFCGFILAFYIHALPSKIKLSYPIFMVPFLIGDAAFGFLARQLFDQSSAAQRLLENRSTESVTVAAIIISLAQTLPLFTYLFWLNMELIPDALKNFIVTNHLSPKEIIRDIYWPKSQNLATVLLALSLLSILDSSAKLDRVLNTSQGTGIESVGHWQERYYAGRSKVSPSIARDESLVISNFVMLGNLAMAGLSIFIAMGLARGFFCRLTNYIPISSFLNITGRAKFRYAIASFALIGLIVISIGPLIPLLPAIQYIKWGLISEKIPMYFLPIVGSFLILYCSLFIGIFLRQYFEFLSVFGPKTIWVILGVLSISAVPPLSLFFCANNWITGIGIFSSWKPVHWIVWLVSMFILFLPIAVCIAIWMLSEIRHSEFLFHRAHKTTVFEMTRDYIFGRFKSRIGIALLFILCLLLTESVVNYRLLDYVPNFAGELRSCWANPRSDRGRIIVSLGLMISPVIVFTVLWAAYEYRSLIRRNRI